MNEEEIKIFIDEYYKLKNIQNSIKEIDKDFFFNLVDKLLYLYNKEIEKNEIIRNKIKNIKEEVADISLAQSNMEYTHKELVEQIESILNKLLED